MQRVCSKMPPFRTRQRRDPEPDIAARSPPRGRIAPNYFALWRCVSRDNAALIGEAHVCPEDADDIDPGLWQEAQIGLARAAAQADISNYVLLAASGGLTLDVLDEQ